MRTHMQTEQQRTSPLFRVFFRFLLTLTSLGGTFFLLSIALAKAMQKPELRNRIRRFNRKTLNPLTLKMAGNRFRIYASLQHVGRRSGRAYSTPVVTRPLGDGFVIPLPYGADVDWCRNVMAAGTCTLRWNGQDYPLEKPELIPPSQALDAYPWTQRLIFAVGGITQYVWLHQQSIDSEQVVMGDASLRSQLLSC